MSDGALFTLKVRESSVDGCVIADCPGCLEAMHLGELWRDLILDEDHEIPRCPDCDPDEWDDEFNDVILDGMDVWALAGDVIKEVEHV